MACGLKCGAPFLILFIRPIGSVVVNISGLGFGGCVAMDRTSWSSLERALTHAEFDQFGEAHRRPLQIQRAIVSVRSGDPPLSPQRRRRSCLVGLGLTFSLSLVCTTKPEKCGNHSGKQPNRPNQKGQGSIEEKKNQICRQDGARV